MNTEIIHTAFVTLGLICFLGLIISIGYSIIKSDQIDRTYKPTKDEEGYPPPGDDYVQFGCNCPDGVTASSYENQIWVHAPAHMPKRNGYCLDRCVAEEVMSLWMMGITTLGCCCGHNGTVPAYIQVVDHDVKRMVELGYEIQHNPLNTNSFIPKFKQPKYIWVSI